MKSNSLVPRFARALALAALLSATLPPAPLSAQTNGAQPSQQQQPSQGMGVVTGPNAVTGARRTAGIVDPKAPVVFEDVTARTALAQFKNHSGTPQKDYIVETVAGGVAVLDYDNDGLPDIYLLNGSTIAAEQGKEKPPRAALYHNLGNWKFEDVTDKAGVSNDRWGMGVAVGDYDNDGYADIYVGNFGVSRLYHNNHDGTFTDVTDRANVAGGTFGMGAAAADYDGDGWQDLYVTAYGRNILYHNNGNGTFVDVTAKAGVAAPGWSTCAVWFDYDKDGKLDLFVSSFVLYDRTAQNLYCTDESKRRYYCVPRLFKPQPSHLFHNNGDGTFTDVSKESGISDSPGKSFGVVATDVNNDGWIFFLLFNDTMPK
nr:VCBS repeat-containing protein [Acidobacteriota bacterium]